jgi:hypothetical protein
MALSSCPECSHEVSESALACPNCGHSFVWERYRTPILVGIGLFLFLAVFYVVGEVVDALQQEREELDRFCRAAELDC